ncbi:MAG: thiamine pyrophosphate-binding protein [Halobacteriovoraceae bacterium]|nr:thiamine pyrophosphate-binding protein [Halobacteriovoraceae bacterium]MCB9095245.1 thiamine pyrophosphate-binding protein [Halobacteriovoraceae bacterium]
MSMTGGEAIAKMLAKEGVTKVFGIIDGTYFGLYSQLSKYGIELITPRHEASAAHMAGAYARISGKLGVCIASNGPGVANLLSGLAVENAEGNRVLAITSCRRPEIAYPDRGGAYQVFDHVAAIRPISKYSETVKSFDRLIEITRQAFRYCFSGRPGVVHLDCPENFMNGKHTFGDDVFLLPDQYRNVYPIHPSPNLVSQVVDLLANAEFPIIHAGSGVIHAQAFEELKTIADFLQTPVTTSWGARGSLCESNELSIPMIYVEANNQIRNEADLVLILGSRLGETDWWGKQPNWASPQKQKIIQVDIDHEYIGRNRALNLGVLSDVKTFLQQLYFQLKEKHKPETFLKRKNILSKHLDSIAKMRNKLDKNLEDEQVPMNTAHVAHACKKNFASNTVAIFDGGNTAVWGQFFYKCTTPGHGISTPKMGMLGAGVGQALGAAVAHPEDHVYCIIGDGAMGFHMQEIETAVRNKLKVVYLVVTDNQWGMVKMNQQFALKPLKTMVKKSLGPDETINADFNHTRWDKLAESMGAKGLHVADPKKLDETIQEALNFEHCTVIHVDVDPVKHMWAPSLLHFKKMHEEPKGK